MSYVPKLEKSLENRNGILYFSGCSTLELAEKYDTPLYIISEDKVRGNYRSMFNAMKKYYSKVRVYYAAKANTNLEVLRILRSEGAWLDLVSPGEVFLALKAGFRPKKILFTGISVREDELRYLLNRGIVINVDALSELEKIMRIKTPDEISVRLNPEVGVGFHKKTITGGKYAKFGLFEDDALEAYRIASDACVKQFGLQMHIGSGGGDAESYMPALEKLLAFAKRIHDELGIKLDFIDMGGGFKVPYKPSEKPLNIEEMFRKILGFFKKKIEAYNLGRPVFCIEPGRYIACDAAVLLTRVNTVKKTLYKKFAGVDAGFNTLIRPAMYDAYHKILVANKLNSPVSEKHDVVGPLCESGDYLAKDRLLPKIDEGDLLAVLNAGAYCFTMSSQYNMRPRAAEVLVKRGRVKLIRERETFKDLLRHQK